MPIRTEIWKIGHPPQQLDSSELASEQQLEQMIVTAPRLLSSDWMLIGRQEDTGTGGRIDLLAIAPDGSLVLIELKRRKTPREVVAQSIDYASWVHDLRSDEIAAIYGRFAPGKDLATEFKLFFKAALDEDSLNQNHQIVIVAASLDDSTERILTYLSKRAIPISVLCFQIFKNGNDQLLSRTWLLAPNQLQESTATKDDGPKEPWNGEFYANFGDGPSRSWGEAVKYGFISAGGGTWYSQTLRLLNPGDRVWVKVPGDGFVGVGRVTGLSTPAFQFTLSTPGGERPALEVLKQGAYGRDVLDDEDKMEYFVPIKWLQTVPIAQAIQEVGMFGKQHSVCKPTTPKWRSTVDRLKLKFPDYDNDK